MAKTADYTTISICQDHVWAGSGKLVDGVISDCAAQFGADQDESENVYELIEEAIADGQDSVKIELSDRDDAVLITWSIVEPVATHRVEYRVYHAPDGCDPSFCGAFSTLAEAQKHADTSPAGLEKFLWDTALAAGHCGGMAAPDGGAIEADEPISWHGDDGYYCVVQAEVEV